MRTFFLQGGQMTDKRSDSTAREIRGEFLEEQKREDKRKAIGYEIQFLMTVIFMLAGSGITLSANIFFDWCVLIDTNKVGQLDSIFYIILFIKFITLIGVEFAITTLITIMRKKINALREGNYD